jgi:ABC-2 type transport system ATP-binding protein
VHAVRGLDFELRRGCVLGLLGANGAGKTSTMAMLAGVLAPTEGRIRIGGHDLLQAPLAAKARLGYLPETPPLFPELGVEEYLRHCARLRGIRGAALGAAVARVMERCGLLESRNRLLGNLSKGYRQRVGIAQAIVHEPDLVILDEPTSGLDPAQIRSVRELIRGLGEEHAVILSTHILPEAQSVCNRVQIIHQGQLVLGVDLDRLDPDDAHRVRLSRAPTIEALQALDMVAGVDREDDGSFRVRLPGGDPVRARFADTCTARGWGLAELSPCGRSLEEIFIEVACGEPEPPRR